MIRYLNISGEQCPADFSIMTLVRIAQQYDVDITGLGELLGKQTSLEAQLTLVANVAVEALNAGAKREGIDKRYNVYDIYDALTIDMSLSQEVLDGFTASFKGSEVFLKPSKATAKPKKGKDVG